VSETPILDDSELSARTAAQKPLRGDLTQGPVGKTLLLFALPTLGSNVLQSLNGSISAIYVGKFLGEDAFAATGIAAMVMFLIFSAVFGLAMAATILIGQAMGRRDLEEVRRTVGATTGAFIAISLVIAALGGLLVEPMLHLLATPAAAFPFAEQFLKVVFVGVPFVFLTVLLQSAMRGVGDAVTPLWTTVINLVLSLVLNPIFILGLGPIPAMGLAGAAWAGVLTNLICLIYMLAAIYWRDLPIRLRRADLHLLLPDWGRLKPVLTIGLPMGLSMIIMSISGLVMMGLINREGVATVAAYNAANQIWSYIQMPAFAVASAVSAMAAQNIGAGRWDRIDRLAGVGVAINVVMTGVLVVAMLLSGHFLLGLFLPQASPAIAIGDHMNWLIGWTFIPMGISMVMTSIVRANGAVLVPLLILVFSVIVVRMTVGFTLHPVHGADAIWWSFMASGTASALMAVAYFFHGGWRRGAGAPPHGGTAVAAE
jgi:putative MATE family efflux protein